MGRPFKMKPAKKPKAKDEVIGKRAVTTIKRKRARGQKPRVVAGTAAARALGIK
jgi:hypothetical protein